MAKKYKLNSLDTSGKQSSVIKVDTMTYIPFVDDNTDYQEYLEWVAEGNTAEAAD
tara:strand:+ start:438 stop:602 length:165 start_codon:yes stop_codon:yes gene_type:complete